MRLRITNRLKGLGSLVSAGIWWLCEWAGDKLFGDAAFGWARGMLSPFAEYPWADAAWTYGIPALLCGIGFYFFLRADKAPSAEANIALPAKAGVIVEVSLLSLPEVFPDSGWIDAIDFVPCVRRLETSKGAPGSRLRFLPDNFETTTTYRLRITLASEAPIYGVDMSFLSDYHKAEADDPHTVVYADNPPEYSEIKTHHIGRLDPNQPYDIWLYTQTNLHVLVRLQDRITCAEIGSDQRRKVQIVSQRGNVITIGPSIPGTDPSPLWRSRPAT